jgi:KaiC/GvpD/RAD55 family RecA-like ATPase
MSLIKKAKREEVPLKLSLSGPSGSGKTYSSLKIAKGLMGGDLSKVVVVDTENKSANLYSDLGDYGVLPFEPPFHPQRYVNAISLCVNEGYKCIIIDSISHEWDGAGGCLDIHTKLGGRFQDWATVTPLHKSFIDAILQAPVHVICTMRRKEEYAMVERSGKMQVQKMGLKEIQRDGFGYEVTINFDISIDHLAVATKDRTGLFDGVTPFMISEETGSLIRRWNLGETVKNDFTSAAKPKNENTKLTESTAGKSLS